MNKEWTKVQMQEHWAIITWPLLENTLTTWIQSTNWEESVKKLSETKIVFGLHNAVLEIRSKSNSLHIKWEQNAVNITEHKIDVEHQRTSKILQKVKSTARKFTTLLQSYSLFLKK